MRYLLTNATGTVFVKMFFSGRNDSNEAVIIGQSTGANLKRSFNILLENAIANAIQKYKGLMKTYPVNQQILNYWIKYSNEQGRYTYVKTKDKKRVLIYRKDSRGIFHSEKYEKGQLD